MTAGEASRKIGSIGLATAKGLGRLAMSAGQGAKSIGAIVLGLIGIREHSLPEARGIGTLSSRLVKLAKNVFVFSVITSGLRKMREMLSYLVSSNAEISASLNAIQVNLLTAFATHMGVHTAHADIIPFGPESRSGGSGHILCHAGWQDVRAGKGVGASPV